MDFLPTALVALSRVNQFIIYKLVPRGTTGKTDKLPISYKTGRTHDAHDPTIWCSFDAAKAMAQAYGQGYGVGFVFTKNDPFFFIDIDDCLQSDNTWSPIAQELCTLFQGAAIEVSSSGRGLHIIGSAHTTPEHECRNTALHIEFYSDGRFVALTGTNAIGDAGSDHSESLEFVTRKYFSSQPPSKPTVLGWTTESQNGEQEPDDKKLIALAIARKNGQSLFGTKASFEDLWENNEERLAAVFPPSPTSQEPYDRSSADAALAYNLAYWTGGNCERIQKLMWESKLVREKWQRADYLPGFTIPAAVGKQTQHFINHNLNNEQKTTTANTENQDIRGVEGHRILKGAQQAEFFKGCVYVTDQHKIVIPGGEILSPDQFRVRKGGFTFVTSADNSQTTKNPWDAFTQSQILDFPKVSATRFKPQLPAGHIFNIEGRQYVNSYYPPIVACEPGDVTPLLNHINLICPTPEDARILMAYLASIVQYQGTKFGWCLVLQGVEGNGKSLLSHIISAAVGLRYTQRPKASEIASKFNGWMDGCTFASIDDIYVPNEQIDVLEILKVMISEIYQALEPKGRDKYMAEVCVNFLINTNHKDGLRKTQNDRRYAPIFMRQQTKEDLLRDKMTSEYFVTFWDWLLLKGGLAYTTYWLKTYPIQDELNPAKDCRVAPTTSSTEEALTLGASNVEQEVMEAIESGQPGLKGGWISLTWLTRMLRDRGVSRRLSPNRCKSLLLNLGYIPHPGLTNGRTDNAVQFDGGKSRIYILKDHKDRELKGSTVIANAYAKAQEVKE